MNNYEAKQEARRERLEAAAERARQKAACAYRRAAMSEAATGIPFGQPILVGHHSEGRHRAAIKRADNAMRAAVENSKRADTLETRAASVGLGGISSDDPDAIAKLRTQLRDARTVQEFMREGNKIIRRAVKAGLKPDAPAFRAFVEQLRALPGGAKVTDPAAAAMLEPDFCGRIGFAGYQLSNNGANIKRIETRITTLERAAQYAEACGGENRTTDYPGICSLVENFEANRIQFFFDGKPAAEVRATLKGHGFRWAPSEQAWQRHMNNAGRYAAKSVIAALTA